MTHVPPEGREPSSSKRPSGAGSIRETSPGTFRLRFRAYGKRESITLRDTTRRLAEDELAYITMQVARGEWIPAEPPAPAREQITAAKTFGELLAEWYASHAPRRNLRPATRARYENHIGHLTAALGHLTLAAVTIAELDRYRDAKLAGDPAYGVAPLAPATVNGHLIIAGAALDRALEYDWIARNPMRVKPENRKAIVGQRVHRWLRNADELALLLDAAGELDAEARADRRHIPRQTLVATLALAGLRLHELAGLRWSDVNLAAGRLEVRRSKTRAGARTVALLGRLRDELAGWKARSPHAGPDDYVFATLRGGRPSEDNLRDRVVGRVVGRATELAAERELAAFPPVGPHDLRRTAISMWLAMGWDVPRVMTAAGHSQPGITLTIYGKALDLTDVERAALRALVEGAPAVELVAAEESIAA